jgi:GNAT superfamily N-acetyltransferase
MSLQNRIYMNITLMPASNNGLMQQLVAQSKLYPKMGDLSLHSDSRQRFGIIIEREGQIVGGAVATINLDWAYVGTLWVDDSLRGQGVGKRLMMAVESYVHKLGLYGVYLYTIDFQAPVFYCKIGYGVMGTLPNRPQGHTATYYSKTDLATDALMDDFYVESPVKKETSAILEAGLDSHATELLGPIIGYERLFVLQDDDEGLHGGLVGHEFWGWLEVNLCYAETTADMLQLLDGVEKFCDVNKLGIELATYEQEQAKLLQTRGYQRMGELQNRPIGKTCTFWIRLQANL